MKPRPLAPESFPLSVCLALLAIFIAACQAPENTAPPAASQVAASAEPPVGTLVDRSEERGLRFRFSDDASEAKRIYETMGGGVTLFDADGDGDLDIFLPGGGQAPGTNSPTHHQALFLNDGQGFFTDATETAGLDHDQGAYSIGAAAGDIDGDGDLDLYVASLGANRLYRNLGNGLFGEVRNAGGTAEKDWSAGALLFDGDGDGDLDLYVTNYVDYDRAEELPCTFSGVRVYCTPDLFAAAPDRYYRNRGDGTFEDATAAAGIVDVDGKGLAAGAADFDDDGDLDIYVANDISPNFLWINDGQGRFTDQALMNGAALGRNGKDEASMGVAMADLDGDLDLDLAVPNFSGEVFNFFRQDDRGLFTEVGELQGLGGPTASLLGFGAVAADFDLDGELDLAFANGHINDLVEELLPADTFTQPNLLLRGLGGRFTRWQERQGDFADRNLGRGLAVGDLDGDGDVDLVLSRVRGDAALFLAQGQPRPDSWLALRPRLPSGAPALGTRATLHFAGGESRVAELTVGGSYASQNEAVLRFGLGGRQPVRLDLRWPGGAEVEVPLPEVGKLTTITAPAFP